MAFVFSFRVQNNIYFGPPRRGQITDGFRNLAIDLIDIFDEELHAQTYYIEDGVSAIYDWLKSYSDYTGNRPFDTAMQTS
jgi:hypothetical protein